MKKLYGVFAGSQFLPAFGIMDGEPFRVIEVGNRFVLEKLRLVSGVGFKATHVCFLGEEWAGFYGFDGVNQCL